MVDTVLDIYPPDAKIKWRFAAVILKPPEPKRG
jgi:hypothetical protein